MDEGGSKQAGLSALSAVVQQHLGAGGASIGPGSSSSGEMTSSPNQNVSRQEDKQDNKHAQPPPAKRARVDGDGANGNPNSTEASGVSPSGVETAASQSAGPGDQQVAPPSVDETQPTSTCTQALPRLPQDGKLLVLDIEGCMTCQDYARKCHEDYTRRHLPAFLTTLSDVDKQRMVRRMQRQMPKHVWDEIQSNIKSDAGNDAVIEGCVHALLENNIQTEELLLIQGQIWKIGRRNTMAQQNGGGEGLEGHIYPDVLPTLGMCKTIGIPVCLYAEPSVKEQMQMMRLSSQGDMGLFITGYFDTATDATRTNESVGPKTDPKSYRAIAQRMNVDIKYVIVLSVNEKELLAARDAGAHAVLRRRPADWSNATNSDGRFPVCSSMMELFQGK